MGEWNWWILRNLFSCQVELRTFHWVFLLILLYFTSMFDKGKEMEGTNFHLPDFQLFHFHLLSDCDFIRNEALRVLCKCQMESFNLNPFSFCTFKFIGKILLKFQRSTEVEIYEKKLITSITRVCLECALWVLRDPINFSHVTSTRSCIRTYSFNLHRSEIYIEFQ